jgi:hypothetical protein
MPRLPTLKQQKQMHSSSSLPIDKSEFPDSEKYGLTSNCDGRPLCGRKPAEGCGGGPKPSLHLYIARIAIRRGVLLHVAHRPGT